MDVRGQKVVVVGLGRTSLSLVKLLLREGARPFVTEHLDHARMAPLKAELESLGVPYECGGHTARSFHDAAVVIPSPGVSPSIPPIAEARAQGCRILGEMEFSFSYCRSKIIAVTGTNGKTTTTELLRALVAACGHTVALAGNNDFPFSGAVQLDPPPEYMVVEVSSYQLETTREFRPWLAAVLNVTPDHLARHGTMEAYAAAKARIFAQQTSTDVAVLNADDEYVSAMAKDLAASVRWFSLAGQVLDGLWLDGTDIKEGGHVVARADDTPLPGRHNLANVLCALTLMRAGGFDWERVLEGLRRFRGVEHRIEYVATIRDVDYYNDSKSTNIDSLKVALESFTRPIVLLAGGQGKGADYRVLRDLVRRQVKHLVVFGEDARALETAFGDIITTEHAGDLSDAVRRGAAAAQPGDVVLLSPACASFDMFDNFEHRGRVFKALVRERCEGAMA